MRARSTQVSAACVEASAAPACWVNPLAGDTARVAGVSADFSADFPAGVTHLPEGLDIHW